MESDKTKGCPNPWNHANIVSKIFFCWLTPLLFKGSSGNLKLSDIYDCPDTYTSKKVTDTLQKEWEKELAKQKSGKKPSLARAAVRAYGLFFFLNGLIPIVEECFVHVLQPILLGNLIQHFARLKVLSTLELYANAAGLCFLCAMFVVTHHTYFFGAQRVGLKLRIACCSLVYRKALRLSQSALGKTTVGQMINLLSNDVNRFEHSLIFFPHLIAGPIQTIIIICILWMHIGYASLVGVSVLMLYIPFQGVMGKLFSKLRMKTAVLTDDRLRLMNEIIAGMRVIKMYGWELPFAKLVDLSRRREMRKIRQTAILRGVNQAMFSICSKVILLLALVVFLLGVQGDLTPEVVFVCLSLFNYLRVTMTLFFPSGVAQSAETLVSLKRIETFLLLEEQSETSQLDASNLRPKLNQCGIWINNVEASWNKDGEATLRNVSLVVKPGELLAVVGPVGCGKSSLLMSILGELPITSGEVKIRGRLAYASQEAWVFAGSVRENVLFGSDFDEDKYRNVISVCALDKDIEQFPYGDQTAVGERGIILSGGQKARVNLARAMYFDADIFLLDDPLSAVDAAVSKHLFEKCINGYLKDKVRILATHQIQFLKQASQILVLKDGGCLALGTYEQLLDAGVDFGSLVEDTEQKRKRLTSTTSTASDFEEVECLELFDANISLSSLVENTEQKRQRLTSRTSTTSATSVTEEVAEASVPAITYKFTLSVNSCGDGDNEENIAMNEVSPKPSEESKSSGSVGLEIYKEYIRSGAGPFLQIMIVILYIGMQIIFSGSDFWLTEWTNLEQLKYNIKDCWAGANKTLLNETGFYNAPNTSFNRVLFRQTVANVSDSCFLITRNYTEDMYDADEHVNMKFRLSIYTGFVLLIFVLSFLSTTAFFELCVRASISLHNKMFRSILRSPVAFFDNNPIGRVLNRFSKDTGVIDESLTICAMDTVTIFTNLVGVFCVVAIVEPYVLIPTIFLGVILLRLRQFYVPTARDVKRYEGIARSPVFSHVSTSLYGLTTIRAFKVQRPFEVIFDHHQDRHTATWFAFLSVTKWFSIVLDWLCVVYISAVIIAMVILSEDPAYASRAGLAITSALLLNGAFPWGVSQSTAVESQMTSVERVIEYSNLKSEADLESKQDKNPPKNWPSKGRIVYKNVSLRYVPNEPPVLKNISFEIRPEEKVGIVGRTGAGKSSMIATLFRMTESEGEVKIDGVYTKDIGLHDLRKKISIIPQDPVLFSGPIRRNLDPFSEHKDDELWQALDEAYLKEPIQEMPGGLDTVVSEGGSNFSVGQRQLICLARAILRRNRILVLDEATANVDPNTDSLIQKTIRNRFAHCTVLTIAHRLHTIMDSDRVLVLDEGEVKEFDEPYNLLQDSKSLFSLMVKMTGPGMAEQLREVARVTHLKNAAKKDEISTDDDVVLMNGANFNSTGS